MKVTVNNVSGEMSVQGVVVTFTPNSDTPGSEGILTQFKSTAVTQLMRSRKDMCSAKLIVGESTYLLRFETGAAREELVEMIVQSQSAVEDVARSPEQWVTASICGAAVDVGMLDQTELDQLLADQYQRGVAQPFDALESLVDRETLQLRVMTEQAENDVLRQIPILAAIFEKTVVDAETKRSFWEAVVRKYFYFSRTFLETEMHQLGEAQGQPAPVAPPTEGLAAINATSLNAMPKSPRHDHAPTLEDNDEDEFAQLKALEGTAKGDEESISPVTRLFRGAPRQGPRSPRRRVSAHSVKLAPMAPLATAPPHTTRNHGNVVRHQLPAEATSREVLESLRKLWRHTADQHAKITIPATPKGRKQSLIEQLCVDRAKEVMKLSSHKPS